MIEHIPYPRHEDAPKLFDDSLALKLSRCEGEAALRAQLDQLDDCAEYRVPTFALAMHRGTASLVVRSRYLEEEVDRAVGLELSST
jgi:hypothetical protein